MHGFLAGRRFRRFWMTSLVLACVALSGAVGFAVLEDYFDADVLLPGADVYGVDCGGYRMPVAAAMVAEEVAAPLLKPLVVQYAGQRWTLATARMATVDSAGMVRAAWAMGYRKHNYVKRAYHRVVQNQVPVSVDLKFRYRDNRVQEFVKRLKRYVDRPGIDSRQLLVGSRIMITPAQSRRDLNLGVTRKLIRDALPKGVRRLSPVVRETPPKKTRGSYGKALVVIKSERRLYLYDKDKLEKTFPVAIGTPGHPTPSGDWHIVNKRYMPWWINPGSGWAAGMPDRIAPGYGNPLGTRALDLDASGIRIHGTASVGSVGTAASHGCMRMYMPDIEDLFDRVPVGTPVFIRNEA